MSLAVFDLDHTLLKGNISVAFGRYLHKEGLLSTPEALYAFTAYLLHLLFHWPPARLNSVIFNRCFKGKRRAVYETAAAAFVKSHLDEMIDPKIFGLLQEAKSKGCTAMLLSASPDFLVAPVAKSQEFDGFSSSEYGSDESGSFAFIAYYGEGWSKANIAMSEAHRLGLSREQIWVVTDSLHDLPLLEVAGRCTVVRASRKLRQIAKIRGWEVL